MTKLYQDWLKLAFITGFLSIGIPFWLIPYSSLNLPDALYGPGLMVIFFAALLLRSLGITSFKKALNVMAATAPAVVIARVIIEGLMDSTSHNLWPLEVIIATVIGYVSVLPGVLIGQLIYHYKFN
jgi:hypothetical protein